MSGASPRPRVVVAMSGGVDSSTAAGLLCEQGFDVIGVTLKLYDASGTAASIGGRCCSPRDIDDARATAARLGFPHYVLDEVDAFRSAVIDDFVDAHRVGRTPNPCVRCNERIKFGPLLRFARAVGAEALATGHYARLEQTADGPVLRRGVDPDKDQAYFLFGLRPTWLAQLRFPIGGFDKDEVRAHARRLGLPNADKPDSVQICFIPDGDHRGFVEARGGAGRPGVVLDERGEVLGEHTGTHLFTIGQRKGVPARDGVRRFVVSVDAETGVVRTGPREAIARTRFEVEDVRWIVPVPAAPARLSVQIRHHAPARAATVAADGDRLAVTLDDSVEGVAPGQAAVFFDGDRVIGGGWIADAGDAPMVDVARLRVARADASSAP